MNTTDPSVGTHSPPTQDERTWGMLAHLSTFAGLVIPLGTVLGPLVVWLVKRDQSAFVADQAKEALNFNITVAILALVSAIFILIFIGFLLLAVVATFWFVMAIVAAIKANEGVQYRYPFAFRLVQ